MAHHNYLICTLAHFSQNGLFMKGGCFKDGMANNHNRDADAIEKRQYENSALAPVNAKLMLQNTDFCATCVDITGSIDIIFGIVLPNGIFNDFGVIKMLVFPVHGNDENFREGPIFGRCLKN